MSRALGDTIAQHIGVSCEPDINVVELDRSCLFLIIASDGVWEFITSDEAVRIAYEAMNGERKLRTQEAADRLTLEAFKRWIEEEGTVVDDNPRSFDQLLSVSEKTEQAQKEVRRALQAVLETGEDLNELVQKSEDLSLTSKQLFKSATKAKKHYACCKIQ
ncbi:protein phosphatase [Cystoisospora suis]|uniref:Protein phosphatase n=1 Tax=Cystoisospora suis TaxID=483139 RepID=A0A2C6KEP1_9APIC|nr:protein phosphatase [Cystoisospora suis]